MSRSRLIVPVLATVLTCFAGCGSSKSSSSTATPSASTTSTTAQTTTTASAKKPASVGKQAPRVPSRTYRVRLRGTAETPAAASKAIAHAVITLRGKSLRVCWTFRGLKGFDKPTVAHIHVGVKGISGNVVVPLSTGPTFEPKGCVQASAALIRAIAKHPRGYYVNIHSKKYPAGAVRSQL